MGDALAVLVFIAFLGLIFVVLWVIRAAERYFRRRESTVELVTRRGSIWGDLKDALVTVGAASGAAIGTLVAGLVWCFGGLIGCVLALLIFGFLGFFLVFWLVKWLW
jgi:hypothetical protein